MSCKRIVVIGPESTGKSTLSEALAKALNTVWVPEYARGYIEALNRPYNEQDLLAIAKGQVAQEDLIAGAANRILVCDTDLYVIKVWSEHKYGRCNSEILKLIAKRKYDLYLLTDIDLPWQYDPQREHEDAAMRRYFHTIYKEICAESGAPFAEINGDYSQRLQQALHAVSTINSY